MNLFRSLVERLSRQQQKKCVRRLRVNRNRFAFEYLESRRVLATLADDGATLTIALAANEALTVKSNETSYLFSSNQTFSNASVAADSDFSAFAQSTLTLNSSGLARYSNIKITDAAAGARVTFADSGVSRYFDSINVTLDSGSTAPLVWEGRSSFAAGQGINVSTQGAIVVGAAALVEATTIVLSAADGITLGGGVYSPDGQVALNADLDGNGVGTLTLQDYLPNRFVQTAKLVDSEPGYLYTYGLGRALSGDGNTLALTSVKTMVGGQENRGGLFIYTKVGSSWTLQQKIVTNIDYSPGLSDVALSHDGNTMILGDYQAAVSGVFGAGAARIYTRTGSTWSEQARIFAPVAGPEYYFGSDVALAPDGNSAIVGAIHYKVGANEKQGAAFVFVRNGNTWTNTQTLTKSNGVAEEYFTSDIVISREGTTAVISANAIGTGTAVGSVVVYSLTTQGWQPQQILISNDRQANDGFGRALDLSADGNILVVGAFQHRHSGFFSPRGAVYIFVRNGNTWVQHQKLVQPESIPEDRFGGSVAISANGDLIMASSSTNSSSIVDRADSHVFVRRGPTWDYFQKNAESGGILLNASGTSAFVVNSARSDAFNYQGVAHLYESQRDLANETAGWVKSSGDLTIAAADFDLRGNVRSQSNLYLNRSQVGRTIDIGSNSTGNAGLTPGELNRLSSPNVIIGRSPLAATVGGPLVISAPTALDYFITNQLELAARDSFNIAFTTTGSIDTRNANLLFQVDGSGSVLSGDAARDFTTGTANVSFRLSTGGVGTSTNPLTFMATRIDSTTTGSVDQFFSAEDTVTIGVAGLNAGSGNIQLVSGIWKQVAHEQVANDSGVIMSGATWDLSTFQETISRLVGHDGRLSGSSGLLTVNSEVQTNSLHIDAQLQSTHGLRKFGTGTTSISKTLLYSGPTIIQSGTFRMVFSGVLPNSSVIDLQAAGNLRIDTTWTLTAGQVFQGSGTVIAGGFSTRVDARVSPGPNAAVLNTRSVSLSSGILDIDILGTAAGQYDQLNVVGLITVGSGRLNLTVPTTANIPLGSQFTIINNDEADAVLGTFTSLPEGAVISVGSGADMKSFQITYRGGDGNDVVLTALSSLAVAIAPSAVSEKNGVAIGTISRAGADTSTALTVSLQSSDTSEATVSGTVVIPIGAVTATFNVTAVDDSLLDGTQTVVITASANSFFNGTASLQILDHETLTVGIAPASISEKGGTATGTVTRSNTDITSSLLVTLSSSDTSEAIAPATVLIPANQSSATFAIDAVDDSLLDGNIVVDITGSAGGYVSAAGALTVTDYETLTLTLSAAVMPESNGSITGTITRNNSDTTQALNVLLASSDTSEATVPASVTIPAGQSSTTFLISSVDDALLDGSQTVTISASAVGYVGDNKSLEVRDVEDLTLTIVPNEISERAGSATASVSRGNSDIAQELIVQLSVDDPTEITLPTNVTIPAGQSSVSFSITAIDDDLVDGTQLVNVTASHNAYQPGTARLSVTDWEPLTLSLHTAAIMENNGTTTATISRLATNTSLALVVSLSSSDTSELVVPATVTIPAGQDSVAFVVSAVDDNLLDGAQTVSVSASASGYIASERTLSVLDFENLSLSIDKASISEAGGLALGTVTRSNTDIAQPLTVNVVSSDTTEATVPAVVTIPANASSATFTITAVDDALLDGTQRVSIIPSAAGYFDQNRELDVTDYELLSLSVVTSSISERGQTAQASITRTDATGPLTIALASSDTTEASVPASITLVAGQLTGNFLITAIDDALLDGSQTVTISASGSTYIPASQLITVTDYEELLVTLQSTLLSELGGSTLGTVTRTNTDIANALIVSLSSTDLSEASVPATVTIPAGQSSATFPVQAADDTLLDGRQTLSIFASSAGYISSSAELRVDDHEVVTLSLNPNTISENGGLAVATVTRSNSDNAAALTVNVTSSDTSEAVVPSTVVIPAGQASVSFNIHSQDDTLLDGSQTVNVFVSATGYVGESRTLTVTDMETLTVTIDRAIINEQGGLATGTVRRSNSDIALPLTVTLVNGDTSEVAIPTSVTIPANQAAATFAITALDDGVDDGAQSVSIAASANGYTAVAGTIIVADGVALALSFDTISISELGGVAVGTVTRANTDTTSELMVTLSSSDASEAQVPSSVTIRTGEQSATFSLLAVDDSLLDGPQVVTITARAPSMAPSTSLVTIRDHEVLSLQFDRASISEAGGQAIGTVTRSNTDIAQEVVVNLFSSDASEATVPASITIPANRSFATFTISAVDDTLLDGTQRISISSAAAGYVGSQRDLDVSDAESLSLSIQALSISENGGATTGVITRSNSDTAAALTVNLLSSDTSEIVVPATITIPGGQSSTSFSIVAVDDSLLDGNQLVGISATASGYAGANSSLTVSDAETLQISWTVASIAENAGSLTGSITRSNTDIGQPLVVGLLSSDTSEITVSASVVIPSGQASVSFTLTVIDDTLLDGSQTVLVTASASGYITATSIMLVTDHEVLGLSLQDATISEAGGVTTGRLTRSNSDIAAALVVAIANSQPTQISLPATVTIPAGQSFATFPITALDDTLLDGTQVVSLTATADGYVPGLASVSVTDAESLSLILATESMSEEGGTISAVVSRSNTDLQNELIIQLVSSDTSEAQVPATITIPTGQQSIAFTIQAVDDTLLDGLQSATLSVSAVGYQGTTRTFSITDAERLTVTLAQSSISERNGVTSGTVTRGNTDIAQSLTLTLTSSDVTEAMVPVSVTIAAGQNAAAFTVTAVDDALLDGNQALTIDASALGYSSGQHALSVTDYETLTLSLSTSELSEDSGSMTVVVSRSNSDWAQPLTVSMASSDLSELQLPTTVVIPAGQASLSIAATVVDDALLDGSQTVVVTASASGYESSSQTLQVRDAEALSLTVDTTSLSEAGGVVNVVLARSNLDNSLPLTVTLTNSDTTEISVPLTVTIPANQAGVSMQWTAVDDSLLDGLQNVTVTALAPGYVLARQVLTILDAETLSLYVSQSVIREAGSLVSAVITRSNSDSGNALVVTLASSDTSEATVPATVTIPAGQVSAAFTISAVDDVLLDGTRPVDIAATAVGYLPGTVRIEVADVESLMLEIDMPVVTENGASATATVSRSNSDTDQPLVISVSTSDDMQLTLPPSVTIPAGLQSTTFAIQATNDGLLDGLQVVLVEVRALGYELDVATLSVADNEALMFSVDIASISERDGRAIGTVARANTNNQQPLTVQLFNSNSSQANVPASVVIPAGAASTTFAITSVNDAVMDGTQSIRIDAIAAGYVSAFSMIEVTDDDRLYPWNNPRNPLDVNDSGLVTALDALLVINALNTRFQLPPTLPDPFDPVQYLDVDANGVVTPLDALLVINDLNRPRNGEGEVGMEIEVSSTNSVTVSAHLPPGIDGMFSEHDERKNRQQRWRK